VNETKKLPRISGGVDHGSERVLISESPDGRRLVWWRPGFTGWLSVGQRGYFPGELVFCFGGDHSNAMRVTVDSGGRRSAAIKKHVAKIVEFVGGGKVPSTVRAWERELREAE